MAGSRPSDLAPHQSEPHPAFTVARAIKGTAHTFHVYLDAGQAYFIRVGLGPGVEIMMAAQGGLIGWLLSRWFSSYQRNKQRQRIDEHRTKTLAQMLAEHKVNQAIRVADIHDAALLPGGWALAKGSVNWRFQVHGEKKPIQCTFRKPEDVTAAMTELPRLFPDLRVEVQFDPRAGKYLKKQT
jgi:hypothetical protein